MALRIDHHFFFPQIRHNVRKIATPIYEAQRLKNDSGDDAHLKRAPSDQSYVLVFLWLLIRYVFYSMQSGWLFKRLPHSDRFGAGHTALGMIIDQTHGLHEGVDCGWTDELPTTLLEIL